MTTAIRMHKTGGPEVLQLETVEVGNPGPGQVRIRQTAIGLNYIDIYHRSGLYPVQLPSGIGMEAAAVIEAVGEGVTGLAVGDRVAYSAAPLGAYAQARLFPADKLVRIPDGISDETAAAAMLQGITAYYLLHQTFPVQRGQTILVHAAAGGVGLLLCQWARAKGVRVLGTVGSEEKAELAVANGCDVPILYRKEDWVARVKAETGGAGVPVVYDSVGLDTYLGSFDSLARRGTLVLFGNASGPVPPLDMGLFAKGSFYVTRPSIVQYTATRDELVTCANGLFDGIAKGEIKIQVMQRFALEQAAEAHRAMEGRKTTGKTILTV